MILGRPRSAAEASWATFPPCEGGGQGGKVGSVSPGNFWRVLVFCFQEVDCVFPCPCLFMLALSFVSLAPSARADDPPPDSPLVKLMKSGGVPEARQGAIVGMIGKRGTAGDLEFLFKKWSPPMDSPLRSSSRPSTPWPRRPRIAPWAPRTTSGSSST